MQGSRNRTGKEENELSCDDQGRRRSIQMDILSSLVSELDDPDDKTLRSLIKVDSQGQDRRQGNRRQSSIDSIGNGWSQVDSQGWARRQSSIESFDIEQGHGSWERGSIEPVTRPVHKKSRTAVFSTMNTVRSESASPSSKDLTDPGVEFFVSLGQPISEHMNTRKNSDTNEKATQSKRVRSVAGSHSILDSSSTSKDFHDSATQLTLDGGVSQISATEDSLARPVGANSGALLNDRVVVRQSNDGNELLERTPSYFTQTEGTAFSGGRAGQESFQSQAERELRPLPSEQAKLPSKCIQSAMKHCFTYCYKRKWYFLFGTILVVGGLVLAIYLTSTKRNGNITNAEDAGQEESDAIIAMDEGRSPSDDAPLDQVESKAKALERLEAIQQLLTNAGISDDELLNKEGTPQFYALKWIGQLDEAKLEPDDEFISQRYALAVFFYSTITTAERNSISFLSDPGYPGSVATIAGWAESTNWMSAKGHCSWAGIKCLHRPGTDVRDNVFDGNNGITHFILSSNNIEVEQLPRELMALRDLSVLDLGENAVHGTIPEELGSLNQLATLSLGDNQLTGTVPTTLGLLSQCEDLYLDNNALEGSIPSELGELTNMESLALYNNMLSGEIPDFSKLAELRTLYLDGNDLSGEISSHLGELTNLVDVRLGSNRFEGTIPTELGNLESLLALELQNNEISGTLPWEFYKMVKLKDLLLQKNRLSGTLPYQIGFLGFFSTLQILHLDNNILTGTIPRAIGNAKELVELYLNDNFLTGGIPEEIDRLEKLTKLRLQWNDLTGFVPTAVCALTGQSLEVFQSDCGGDEPKVECGCCTECF